MSSGRRILAGRWRSRVYQLVETLGHKTLRDYVQAHPTRSIDDLSADLGFVGVELHTLYLEEALENGWLIEATRELLARNLFELLPEGWGRGPNPEFQTVLAMSTWQTDVLRVGHAVLTENRTKAILDDLHKENPPPAGWRPLDGQDPILVAAFEHVLSRG